RRQRKIPVCLNRRALSIVQADAYSGPQSTVRFCSFPGLEIGCLGLQIDELAQFCCKRCQFFIESLCQSAVKQLLGSDAQHNANRSGEQSKDDSDSPFRSQEHRGSRFCNRNLECAVSPKADRPGQSSCAMSLCVSARFRLARWTMTPKPAQAVLRLKSTARGDASGRPTDRTL